MFNEMGIGGFCMFGLFAVGVGIFVWKSLRNTRGAPIWMRVLLLAGSLLAIAATCCIIGAIH